MDDTVKALLDDFQEYFSLAIALTPEQKRAVYRIRYRVYCEEFAYEPLDAFPDGLESDEFDDHALHCLVMHQRSAIPAACVRMVWPEPGREQLPFEKHCGHAIDPDLMSKLDVDRSRVCEISRLAVDGAFRRRSGEHATRFGLIAGLDVEQSERRTFSLVAVSAFLSGMALTSLTGRNHVFAMMEPFLPRLLQMSGINFRKAGHEIDYHGLRAPYFGHTQDGVDGMLAELRSLYEVIHSKFDTDLAAVDAAQREIWMPHVAHG